MATAWRSPNFSVSNDRNNRKCAWTMARLCWRAVHTASSIALLVASIPASAALLITATAAYPSKPIRVLVLGSPGSGPHIVMRLIGGKFTEAWGQQVVIDVRPGAAGRLGAEIAARSAPDGYTLVMVSSQAAIVSAMFDKLSYDLINDFSPISLLASVPHIMVAHPAVPIASVKDLVALAKTRPGQLHYGSAGAGSPQHLEFELLKSMTGIELFHVPYKGAGPAMMDVVAGQIQLMVQTVPVVMPLFKTGKVRALRVTSLTRSPLAPELPTISDSVPGYEFIGWYGLAAPAGTSANIIAKLNQELVRIICATEFRERLFGIGVEPLVP